MDDFRIIFYVILGIIFIVSRVMKAGRQQTGKPRPTPRRPRPSAPQEDTTERPVPTSLEDMLKEFGKTLEPQAPQQEKPRPKPAPVTRQYEEGRDRRFSDEESRKVYEESIKKAEGFDIKFKENENFASKRTIFGEGAVAKDHHKKNPLTSVVREELQKPDSAKKAVILAEILNRRY